MNLFEKIAEGECRGQKHSEVRPQGGQVYNYKALQHVGGEPPVLALALSWEPFFSDGMTKFFLHANIKSNEKDYLFYYHHISIPFGRM